MTRTTVLQHREGETATARLEPSDGDASAIQPLHARPSPWRCRAFTADARQELSCPPMSATSRRQTSRFERRVFAGSGPVQCTTRRLAHVQRLVQRVIP